MNLSKKKKLAAKILEVGKNRIIFDSSSLNEIKEAITREDIKTLHQEGIIKIKPVRGRRKKIKRKTRRGIGKIKKKIKSRKQNYVKITRKLRKYLKELKNRAIDRELYWQLRKKIKNKEFKSKDNFKDYLKSIGVKTDSFGKQVKTEAKNAAKSAKAEGNKEKKTIKKKDGESKKSKK